MVVNSNFESRVGTPLQDAVSTIHFKLLKGALRYVLSTAPSVRNVLYHLTRFLRDSRKTPRITSKKSQLKDAFMNFDLKSRAL